MTPREDSTSLSLIRQVQAHEPNAWQQLCDIYSPLVYRWRFGGSDKKLMEIQFLAGDKRLQTAGEDKLIRVWELDRPK